MFSIYCLLSVADWSTVKICLEIASGASSVSDKIVKPQRYWTYQKIIYLLQNNQLVCFLHFGSLRMAISFLKSVKYLYNCYFLNDGSIIVWHPMSSSQIPNIVEEEEHLHQTNRKSLWVVHTPTFINVHNCGNSVNECHIFLQCHMFQIR